MGLHVRHARLWPRGIVPVAFAGSVDQNKPLRRILGLTMRRWEHVVNNDGILHIQFRLRRNEANYVEFVWADSTTATASIGVTNGRGLFRVSLSVIQHLPHELGHQLGLEHEHLRNADRPLVLPLSPFEDVGRQARLRPIHGTFQAESSRAYAVNCIRHGSFDSFSIMHYRETAGWTWSNANLPALNTPSAEDVVLGAWAPSDGDVATLRTMYPG
jgi:hypothetical protein